jgi:3'-5' exoribonuclease
LLAGAALHDVGKLEEYTVTSSIKRSPIGKVVGHLVLSVEHVTKRTQSMPLSEEKRIKLLNMLISHHRLPEHGSPLPPATPEAMALHFADAMDALVHVFLETKQDPGTDDDVTYKKAFGHIYLR